MSLCSACQPAVALELHAPACRPLRSRARVALLGGSCLGGRGAGAQSTVARAPPCLVWLLVGQLLPTGSNSACISP